MVLKYIRFLIKNYLFAVVALFFTASYWLSARRLPPKALDFPKAILLVLIPLFIWNGVNSVKEFKKTLADSQQPEEDKWDCTLHITSPKVIVTAITVVYTLLIPVIGFFVCTVVYLAVLAFYLGIRKPVPLLLFTVLFTGAVYGIFVLWLRVFMPAGVLF